MISSEDTMTIDEQMTMMINLISEKMQWWGQGRRWRYNNWWTDNDDDNDVFDEEDEDTTTMTN